MNIPVLCVFLLFQASAYKLDVNNLDLKDYFITSTRLTYPKPNNRTKRDPTCNYFDLDIVNYKICVQSTKSYDDSLIPQDMPVYIYHDNFENVSSLTTLNINLATGYVVNYEKNSTIDGYIENEIFYGRIVVKDEVYYVEKLSYYPNLHKTRSVHDDEEVSVIYKSKHIMEDIKFIKYPQETWRAPNICEVFLITDYSFVQYIGGSQSSAVAIALNSMHRANTIFRSTDFDGDGTADNIGFKVNYILVMSSESEQYPYILPRKDKPVPSNNYIIRLSALPNLGSVCLGIGFTAQPFQAHVIGLSFTAMKTFTMDHKTYFTAGGICVTGYGENFNVAVVTYFNTNVRRVPQLYCDISLAHELGHTFGSVHDEGKQCKGYLMAAKTTEVVTRNTFMFSPCSKKQISKVLESNAICFTYDTNGFCGNGIVEEGEECDCGSYFNCIYGDHCCLPMSHKQKCRVNRDEGYTCHPTQGLCCTQLCQIRDLSYLGLSCKDFLKKCSKSSQSSCGIEGSCVKNHCHSKECTRINLSECSCPKNNGTSNKCYTCCNNSGKCIAAYVATQLQINKDPKLMEKLIEHVAKHKFVKKGMDLLEEYCNVTNVCVKLGFKIFRHKDFCVLNGDLGVCRADGQCYVERQKFTNYPKFSSSSDGIFITAFKTFLFFVLNEIIMYT